MSDIVKKGFFRRCLYRATGAYLLEQHIQMLEQQVKTQQMQLAQMEKEREERKAQDAQQQQFNTTSQERLDHLELHAAAQDEHRNNIDAQLQLTAGQTNDLQRRMEWAEDGMREAVCCCRLNFSCSTKKAIHRQAKMPFSCTSLSCWVFRFHNAIIWTWVPITPAI